ncbi:MAG: glycosyltransferase, partial [Candidatus Hydrogenedentes bacterium]|nr:glycosyltransferase [Candidatus Hydrogenedentota bacterium]
VYGLMMVFAVVDLRRRYRLDKSEMDEDAVSALLSKPVSILVPAYNEDAGIVDSVRSLLGLRYPQTEIIIVNDGSKDQTLKLAIEQFRMHPVKRDYNPRLPTKEIRGVYQSAIHPHLFLVDKENGGKADALNAGINLSRYPYFCSIDGDSILEESSLLRAMKPILRSGNEVIATGGSIRIANGHKILLGSIFKAGLSDNMLVLTQMLEYVRAFLVGRVGLSKYNLVLIISGAFGVFLKQPVVEVGGYSTKMIGEDMELVLKLHRWIKTNKLNKRMEYTSEPICWTEAPQSMRVLRLQRRRWHQGLIDSLWKHRNMTLNLKYGAIGVFALPYYWIVECLGPVIELGGYIYLIFAFFTGKIYLEFAILLGVFFVLVGMLYSVSSILLEAWSMSEYPNPKQTAKLVLISLVEPFWYRPLTLIWRMEGIVQSLLRRKVWGDMQRSGLSGKEGRA